MREGRSASHWTAAASTPRCRKRPAKRSPMPSRPRRPRKATSVPSRANPQATFAGAPPRQSSTGRSTAIAAQGPQTIHQRPLQANHGRQQHQKPAAASSWPWNNTSEDVQRKVTFPSPGKARSPAVDAIKHSRRHPHPVGLQINGVAKEIGIQIDTSTANEAFVHIKSERQITTRSFKRQGRSRDTTTPHRQARSSGEKRNSKNNHRSRRKLLPTAAGDWCIGANGIPTGRTPRGVRVGNSRRAIARASAQMNRSHKRCTELIVQPSAGRSAAS